MSKYELHPLALVIPEASPEDYNSLVESIEKNGQIEPIRLLNGLVLDGRHRLRACEALGIEPIVEEIEGLDDQDEGALLSYVMALNIHRRQASASQRALAAARFPPKQHGRPKDHDVKRGSEDTFSRETLAAMFNVSEASISRARSLISEADPRVVELVERGVLSLAVAVEKHHELSVLATVEERAGQTADFAELAAKLTRVKGTNKKLRQQVSELVNAGKDVESQAAAYARQLEEALAKVAQLEGQMEASGKGLTVAPPKVITKVDPELDQRLKDAEKLAARLEEERDEARREAAHNAALLARSDDEVVDKTRRLNALERPDQFIAYAVQDVEEFTKRMKAIIAITQRSEEFVPGVEQVYHLETAIAESNKLCELWRNRRAISLGSPRMRVLPFHRE